MGLYFTENALKNTYTPIKLIIRTASYSILPPHNNTKISKGNAMIADKILVFITTPKQRRIGGFSFDTQESLFDTVFHQNQAKRHRRNPSLNMPIATKENCLIESLHWF